MYTGRTKSATATYGQTLIENQTKRRKLSWLGHTLRRNDDSIAKQASQWKPTRRTRPQKKRVTREYLEKRLESEMRTTRIQLWEDGGGGSRQNWMDRSGLWSICSMHWERQHKSSQVCRCLCPQLLFCSQ